MSGISNINIVIQQGDMARDVNQLKAGHQDSQQVAASVVPDKEVKERTQVQESPESKKLRWQKKREKQEKRKNSRSALKNKKGKNQRGNNSNHILDTIV